MNYKKINKQDLSSTQIRTDDFRKQTSNAVQGDGTNQGRSGDMWESL